LVFSAQCLLVAAAFLGVILVLSAQHSAAYTDAVLEQIYLRQVNANASILTPMILRESAIHRLGAKVNHEVHNPANAMRLQVSGFAVSDRMSLSSMRPFFNDAYLLVDGDPLLKMVAQMQYSNFTKNGGLAKNTTPVADRHLNLASVKNELTLSSLYVAIVRNASGEMILQPKYPVVMEEDGGYAIRLPYDPSEEPAIKNNNLDSLAPAWRGPYAIFDPVTAGGNAPPILSAFFIYPIQMFAPPWQRMVEHAVVCQMDLSYFTQLAAQAALSPVTTALIFSAQNSSEMGDGGGGHFYASSHPHTIPPYNAANRTTWTALDFPIAKYRNQYLEARRRCLAHRTLAVNDNGNNSFSASLPDGQECDYVIFEFNNANGASAGSIFRLNSGELDIVSLIVMATTSGIHCNLLQTTPRSYFFAASERSAAYGIGIGAAGALIVIVACIAILIAIRSQLRVLVRAMRLAADMRNDEAATKSHERSATLSEMRALQLTFEQMNRRLLLARPFLPQSLLVVQSLVGAEDSFSSGTHDYDHLGSPMMGGGEGEGMLGADDLAVSIAASLARRTSQLSVGGFLSGGDAYSRSIFDDDDEVGNVDEDEGVDPDGFVSDYETLYWRQLGLHRARVNNSPQNEANEDVQNGGVGQGGFELDPPQPSAVPFHHQSPSSHRSSIIHSDRESHHSDAAAAPRHRQREAMETTNSSEGELDPDMGPSSCSPIVRVRSRAAAATTDASTSASNSKEEDNTGSSSDHRPRLRPGNNNIGINIRSADAPSSPVALSGLHPGNNTVIHPSAAHNNAANTTNGGGGGNRKVGFHHHFIVASSSLSSRGNNGAQQQPSKRAVVGGASSSASSPQFTHLASVHSKSLMRTVGVLCVNLRNFHRLSSGGGGGGGLVMSSTTMPTNSSVDYLQRIHSLICAVVESAANAERGIVDSFQGDHFIVTFNAARPVASIAQSAATVAMRIADEGERIETVLGRHHPFTMGLAMGRALVGNMGTDTMKRLCTVGRVVPEAVLLERMCRRVGQSCLATERTCADLEGVVRAIVVGRAKLFEGNGNTPQTANGNNKFMTSHQQHMMGAGAENPNFQHSYFHHQHQQPCAVVSGTGRGVVRDPSTSTHPSPRPLAAAAAAAAPPAYSPASNALSPHNDLNRPHDNQNADEGTAVMMLEALHPDLLVTPLEKQPRQQQQQQQHNQQQHVESCSSDRVVPLDTPSRIVPSLSPPPPPHLPLIHALAHVITRGGSGANEEWMYELKQGAVDDPFQHYNDAMAGLLMMGMGGRRGGAKGDNAMGEETMEECRAMLAESLQRCASSSFDSFSIVESDNVGRRTSAIPKLTTVIPTTTAAAAASLSASSPFGCDDGAAAFACQQLPGSVELSAGEHQQSKQQREETADGRKSSGVMLSLAQNDSNGTAAVEASMSSSTKHVVIGGAGLAGLVGAARRKVSFPQTPLHNLVMLGGNHSNATYRSFEAQGSRTPSNVTSSDEPNAISIFHNYHDRFPELDPFHLPKPRSAEWARQRLLRAMYLCCSAPRNSTNNHYHPPSSSLSNNAASTIVPPATHHQQPPSSNFTHAELLRHTHNNNSSFNKSNDGVIEGDRYGANGGGEGEEGSPTTQLPHFVVCAEDLGAVAQLLCYNMTQ